MVNNTEGLPWSAVRFFNSAYDLLLLDLLLVCRQVSWNASFCQMTGCQVHARIEMVEVRPSVCFAHAINLFCCVDLASVHGSGSVSLRCR